LGLKAKPLLGGGVASGIWGIWNPCGITNANFVNGEKRAENVLSSFGGAIQSRTAPSALLLTTEDSIADPAVLDTWEAWSDNEAMTAGTEVVELFVSRDAGIPGALDTYLEVADVTLTLDSANTPSLLLHGAEQSNYQLSCTITNNTTGDGITLDFGMILAQQLKADTDLRTVTYLADSTNQFQALALKGGTRKDWLKLQPGANTIQFDETGLVAVTLDLEWEERHYT
jgi:hypothetical protein